MSISKKNAKKLAVAYQAYCEATDKNDNANSIVVWGRMLIDAQTKTRVELLDAEVIEIKIAAMRKKEMAA
jgi:hypothetical protein